MGAPPQSEFIRAVSSGTDDETRTGDQPPGKPSAGKVTGARKATGRLAYEKWLKREIGAVIDQIELSELQKRCLRARWLDAVTWMESKANHAQRTYYALRLLIIIGGLIVPALVSLNLGDVRAAELVRWATFGLSLLVAISAAIEGFFRYGERWRHYRSIVERLKIEGWQFFQLSGPYAQHGSHATAYTAFAARVEEIIQSDLQQYITEVVREKQAPSERTTVGPESGQPAPPFK